MEPTICILVTQYCYFIPLFNVLFSVIILLNILLWIFIRYLYFHKHEEQTAFRFMKISKKKNPEKGLKMGY